MSKSKKLKKQGKTRANKLKLEKSRKDGGTKPRQTRAPRKGVILRRKVLSNIWKTRGIRLPERDKTILVTWSGEFNGRLYKLESQTRFPYLKPRQAAVEVRNLLQKFWNNNPNLHSIQKCQDNYNYHMRIVNEMIQDFDADAERILMDIRKKMLNQDVQVEEKVMSEAIRTLDLQMPREVNFQGFDLCPSLMQDSLLDLAQVMYPEMDFSDNVDLYALCQQWNRNRNKKFRERWQVNGRRFSAYQVKRTFKILDEMRMLQAVIPTPFQDYSAIVVQGSALFRAKERMNFVTSVCRNYRIGKIYILGSDRKLDARLESDQKIQIAAGAEPTNKIDTEFKMLKHLWTNRFMKQIDVPVDFIQARSRPHAQRAGSLEIAFEWYLRVRRSGDYEKLKEAPVLAVSNQPHLRRWYTILRVQLPIDISVEAAGPATSVEYFKANVHTFLDSVYRWLQEAKINNKVMTDFFSTSVFPAHLDFDF